MKLTDLLEEKVENTFKRMVKAFEKLKIKGKIEIDQVDGKPARYFLVDSKLINVYKDLPEVFKKAGFTLEDSYGAYDTWQFKDAKGEFFVQAERSYSFRIAPKTYGSIKYGTSQGDLRSILTFQDPDEE